MTVRTIIGDCRAILPTLPADSVHCVVTSPPYWSLRDYGVAGQIGLEPTYQAFIAEMVAVFREVRRVLRPDGTLWLNLGDSYSGGGGFSPDAPSNQSGSKQTTQGSREYKGRQPAPGLKSKDLCGIPWRVAFALQEDGWWLRQDIIWAKPNPMPESVTDRCTKAHEYMFLMSKSARYYFDAAAIAEPFAATPRQPGGFPPEKATGPMARSNGHSQWEKRRTVEDSYPNATRNKRSVWEIATAPFSEAHFATFPPALIEPCVKAGTSEKGCCAKCGAPWVREIGKGESSGIDGRCDNSAVTLRNDALRHSGREVERSSTTLGWSASCKCAAAVVPCTVLDPFGGAGTTGLVADRLQRNAILIELNPKYAEMAERRITGDAPLFAETA